MRQGIAMATGELPDHPGRGPRVRPVRLRADAAGAARRHGATSSTAAGTWSAAGTRNQSLAAYLGGRSLSLAALLATGRYLTDTVTAYKLFRRADLASLDLQTTGFELDHEITARLLARGLKIVEVPIRYAPRSREEGKKIGAARLVHRTPHVLSL